jgi:hypothetical protein
MTATIEFLFVAAGLFCLVWAIVGHGNVAARIGAGIFGILALIVVMILRGDARDDHDWYHRDY